ncbi:hypothetical protein SNEBB_000712 [Seison nebaliae]|nr:hypothetical protein SNEBB_000712 [Seison nebaliae]
MNIRRTPLLIPLCNSVSYIDKNGDSPSSSTDVTPTGALSKQSSLFLSPSSRPLSSSSSSFPYVKYQRAQDNVSLIIEDCMISTYYPNHSVMQQLNGEDLDESQQNKHNFVRNSLNTKYSKEIPSYTNFLKNEASTSQLRRPIIHLLPEIPAYSQHKAHDLIAMNNRIPSLSTVSIFTTDLMATKLNEQPLLYSNSLYCSSFFSIEHLTNIAERKCPILMKLDVMRQSGRIGSLREAQNDITGIALTFSSILIISIVLLILLLILICIGIGVYRYRYNTNSGSYTIEDIDDVGRCKSGFIPTEAAMLAPTISEINEHVLMNNHNMNNDNNNNNNNNNIVHCHSSQQAEVKLLDNPHIPLAFQREFYV